MNGTVEESQFEIRISRLCGLSDAARTSPTPPGQNVLVVEEA